MFEWFFLFKQKTAYEVLISDWSSDVCSSDLGFILSNFRKRLLGLPKLAHTICECEFLTSQALDDAQELLTGQGILFLLSSRQWFCPLIGLRSDESRVGQECVSRCRSRWSSYH